MDIRIFICKANRVASIAFCTWFRAYGHGLTFSCPHIWQYVFDIRLPVCKASFVAIIVGIWLLTDDFCCRYDHLFHDIRLPICKASKCWFRTINMMMEKGDSQWVSCNCTNTRQTCALTRHVIYQPNIERMLQVKTFTHPDVWEPQYLQAQEWVYDVFCVRM